MSNLGGDFEEKIAITTPIEATWLTLVSAIFQLLMVVVTISLVKNYDRFLLSKSSLKV